MQKIFFVAVAVFSILYFSNGVLTKVNREEVDSSVLSTMDTNLQISAHVLVSGIGISDFISLPLGDGPFKPRITTFEDVEAEKIYTALLNISRDIDYNENSFHTQKVVFGGFLAVLNRKVLSKFANVHDCDAYSIEVHRFFTGITISYNCTPEM